ncbi:MAG TPA: hypothetical protein VFW08_11010 [bacterium]|nr:hypothetical protein [bacterium]
MTKGVLLVVLLAVSVAQILPSCEGGERTITGWVEAKYWHGRRQSYVIVINNTEYNVPDTFYDQVGVGDLVKREAGVWTIVRKKGT